MRSFVFLTALVIATSWVAIRHLPKTAEADVVRTATHGAVQGVSFNGRSLPVAALREAIVTKRGSAVDANQLIADRDALIATLAERGYLVARVSDARVSYAASGAAFVTFAVSLGPQFSVRSVTVAGASQLEAGVVTLAAGEVFAADRIARAREALADRLAARGKPSTVTALLATDEATGLVDIELVVRQ